MALGIDPTMAVPELVRDTELPARIQGRTTIHPRLSGNRTSLLEERWTRLDDNILGHGGSGLVWRERKETVREGEEEKWRAVKAIRILGNKGASGSQRYWRELEALAKFSRPRYSDYIVQCFGWFEVPSYLCIAMELCEHGDLKTYLEHAGRVPEDQARTLAAQVLAGLAMMHEAGFAHRDVKPANILIKSTPPGGWWAKIGDLGLSKRAEDIAGSSTVRGTPGFMAPESLGFRFPSGPSPHSLFLMDMWCFGETVYQMMLTGEATFPSVAALFAYCNGVEKFPDQALVRVGASFDAFDLIRSLMAANPLHRPSPWIAQSGPWLKQNHRRPASPASFNERTSNDHWLPLQAFPSPSGQLTQASGQWTMTTPVRREDLSTPVNALPGAISVSSSSAAAFARHVSDLDRLWPRPSADRHPPDSDAVVASRQSMGTLPDSSTQTQDRYQKDEGAAQSNSGVSEPEDHPNPPTTDSAFDQKAAGNKHDEPATDKIPPGNFREFIREQRQVLAAAELKLADLEPQSREEKLAELKRFSQIFELSRATPVPADLLDILAKDPEKRSKRSGNCLAEEDKPMSDRTPGTKPTLVGQSQDS